MAKWLQDFHYQTILIGKYVNGYHADGATPMEFCTYVPPGWTDWYGFQTIDFFGTRVNENGRTVLYPEAAYQTDIIANLSDGWLGGSLGSASNGKGWDPSAGPFFMMLTPHAPHAPYTPAPRHKGTLNGTTMPRDLSFNMADTLRLPGFSVAGGQGSLPGGYKNLSLQNGTKMDRDFQARAESLLAIDEMIARLLARLESASQLDRTYIFCQSRSPVLVRVAVVARG